MKEKLLKDIHNVLTEIAAMLRTTPSLPKRKEETSPEPEVTNNDLVRMQEEIDDMQAKLAELYPAARLIREDADGLYIYWNENAYFKIDESGRILVKAANANSGYFDDTGWHGGGWPS